MFEPLVVRSACAQDLDALVRFNSAMAWESECKSLDEVKVKTGVSAVLEDPLKGFYLIAERQETPVGQLMVTDEWSDWRNAYFWWIQSVYVVPEHRRQGVYRALDRKVHELARERGDVCGVRLYVDRDNQRAQKVYSSLGMSLSHYDMYEVEFSD